MTGKAQPAYGQPGAWPQGQQQQQPPAGYGQQPPAGYGAAPPAGYGASAPAGPYGSAPGGANPYGAPAGGYAPAAPGGYGTQGAAPGGYGAPPATSGGYGAPPATTGGYGGAPGGYGAPAPGGYGAPAPGGYGYGGQQQYPPPQQQGYPAPGGGGFPAGTDPEVVRMFQQADADRSGTIDANELGRVLSQGRVAFSPRTLRLMLHLFADNKSDTTRIGPVGFAKLWKEIQQWNKKFHEFDRDNSGSIEVAELQAALMSFNFNIPSAVLQMLVAKYDVTGGSRSIGYDNFVECGFIVKGLTEKFKDQDRGFTGNATFDYTTFMLMVIPFVAA
ncbi:hypothetical protein KC19_7G131200 [Ceratodon purpureus]|uniref:EF-hand domain-containing protein n=1 Tax=Ceratodon purpureus TaxID=3225 RepID=A0A8T0HEC0_CERPU|nr:hypothetical protein KC19_7G131200 [Ceratodon purpureus]